MQALYHQRFDITVVSHSTLSHTETQNTLTLNQHRTILLYPEFVSEHVRSTRKVPQRKFMRRPGAFDICLPETANYDLEPIERPQVPQEGNCMP